MNKKVSPGVKLFGGGILALLMWAFLPMLELIQMFIYVVLFPVMFAGGIIMALLGVKEVAETSPEMVDDLKNRVKNQREALKNGTSRVARAD